MVPEETIDKESIPLTASSSLTLRTTSDDDVGNADPPLVNTIATQQVRIAFSKQTKFVSNFRSITVAFRIE